MSLHKNIQLLSASVCFSRLKSWATACSPPVADVNYGVKNILDIFIKSTQFFMAALSVLGQ